MLHNRVSSAGSQWISSPPQQHWAGGSLETLVFGLRQEIGVPGGKPCKHEGEHLELQTAGGRVPHIASLNENINHRYGLWRMKTCEVINVMHLCKSTECLGTKHPQPGNCHGHHYSLSNRLDKLTLKWKTTLSMQKANNQSPWTKDTRAALFAYD